MVLLKNWQLVTIDIFYYRLDYRNLIQEFVWQTEDVVPELYRVHKFLNHWHKNIEAVIQEVQISINDKRYGSYRNVDEFLNLH
jgi:uncharacterized protein Usg